uniref:Uncharacterized protein isoform X2 n=1 Tax=Pogona vitticeps TaxID=103695 RepID=A0ABM5FT86_9SAUR
MPLPAELIPPSSPIAPASPAESLPARPSRASPRAHSVIQVPEPTEPARKKKRKTKHLEPEAPAPPLAPAQQPSSSIPFGLSGPTLSPFDVASFMAFQQWQGFCKQFQQLSPYAATTCQGPTAVPQFLAPPVTASTMPSVPPVQKPPATSQIDPCVDRDDFLDFGSEDEEGSPGSSPNHSPFPPSASESDEDDQAGLPPPDTPAKVPTVGSHPPSPSENYTAYTQLVRRMAEVLDMSVVQPTLPKSDKVFEDMVKDQLAPIKLTFIPSLLTLAKETWARPSASLLVPRRAGNLYKVHGDDTDFLQLHPTPKLLGN